MINLKRALLFLTGTVLTGCTDKNAPDNLISKSEMIEILTEIQVTEARLSRLNVRSFDSTVVAFNYLQSQIFEKHGVDSMAYVNSYTYYASRPDQFAEMFGKVEENIQELETKSNENQTDGHP